MRLHSTQPMEIEYETPPEPDSSPTILLNAVALAMLRSDTTIVMVREIMMALRGMGVPMVVIFRSHPLKGIPSSRANAQTWRDPAARTLRLPQMLSAATIDTIAIVPPVLPVAA